MRAGPCCCSWGTLAICSPAGIDTRSSQQQVEWSAARACKCTEQELVYCCSVAARWMPTQPPRTGIHLPTYEALTMPQVQEDVRTPLNSLSHFRSMVASRTVSGVSRAFTAAARDTWSTLRHSRGWQQASRMGCHCQQLKG